MISVRANVLTGGSDGSSSHGRASTFTLHHYGRCSISSLLSPIRSLSTQHAGPQAWRARLVPVSFCLLFYGIRGLVRSTTECVRDVQKRVDSPDHCRPVIVRCFYFLSSTKMSSMDLLEVFSGRCSTGGNHAACPAFILMFSFFPSG